MEKQVSPLRLSFALTPVERTGWGVRFELSPVVGRVYSYAMTIHLQEADVVRDFELLMERVRAGDSAEFESGGKKLLKNALWSCRSILALRPAQDFFMGSSQPTDSR